MRKLVVSLLLALLAVPATTLAAGKKPVIALSNSFYGNSWRKQMVDTMQEAAKEAKAKGLISDFIVANGDGTENTQIQQFSGLVLQKVDAIVLNAASLTGLNGVIAKAHQQGIKVIAFDSIVSSPYAYKIEYDNKSWGELSARYIVDRFKGKANVLMTRGVMGSAPEKDCYDAMMKVFRDQPGIKLLAEVDTEADIARYARGMEFPIIPCNLCGSQDNLQRQKIRAMMADWDRRYPGRTESVVTALQNVVPSHLADTALFDFAQLSAELPAEAGDTVFDPPELPPVGQILHPVG